MRPQAHLIAAVLTSLCYWTEPTAARAITHDDTRDAPHAPFSQWMASSMMSRRQGIMTGKGGVSETLQAGFTQKAFLALQALYADAADVRAYIEESAASVVPFLEKAPLKYPLDRLSNGMALLDLSSSSDDDKKFADAADVLRKSIDDNRRNSVGGLWYFTYPDWSYLDGMYSLAPFYTLYTQKKKTTVPEEEHNALNDMYYQIDLLWNRTRDPHSGLLAHGYDASGTAVWAAPGSGASPHVWDRALGWYLMALVDTVELLSPSPTGSGTGEYRSPLLEKYQSLAKAVIAAVDPVSGAWWQVMDEPGRDGNYIEASGSAMFTYALLKGARLGYLDVGGDSGGKPPPCACARHENDGPRCRKVGASMKDIAVKVATRAYNYLTATFVVYEPDSVLGYNGTVSVCSLNSTASYEVSKFTISVPAPYL